MPVNSIFNPTATQTIGIWEISETEDQLRKICGEDIFNDLQEKLPAQRLSKLAVHALLLELCGSRKISKTEKGKPVVDIEMSISYSHSGRFAALSAEKKGETGVDIQVPRKGMKQLSKKFLSVVEENIVRSSYDPISTIHKIWCMKESVYKFYGNKGLIFKDQIQVQPFNDIDRSTTVILKAGAATESIQVGLDWNDEFYLAYVIK